MSLSTIFQNTARGQGLVSRFGAAAIGTPEYMALHERSLIKAYRADALRAGQPVMGRKLDGAPAERRDSIARDTAMALDWAEWYDDRFGRGAGSAFLKRLDATTRRDSTVPMASQGLTYFMPEVYEIRHPELPCWNEKILAVDKRPNPAAEQVVWYEMDNVGVAHVANSYSITDIPMVNGPIASDNVIRIVPAMVGMETNFMDPRRESFAASQGKPNFQIDKMKREACQKSIAQFFDALWFGGDGSLGIDGLMNNPIVETLTIVGTWASKTALQILDDLKTMVWTISNRTIGSLGDLGKIKIILPPAQYQLLLTPMTAAGTISILDYFISTFKSGEMAGRGVPKIDFEYKFAASNSYAYNGGPNMLSRDTAIVVYQDGDLDKDPSFILTQVIEVPAPVRTTGVGDVTYYHARGGGLRLPDAQRMIYVAGL